METNGLRDALLRSVFAEDAPVEVSTQATPQAEQRPAEVSAQRSSKAIDLWYLFPLGVGVLRLLSHDGKIDESWQKRLDLTFGATEWKSRFYKVEKTQDLFGNREIVARDATAENIQTFIQERLATCFAKVAKGLILRNSKSSPLYSLCFAAANIRGAPTALKIAQHILDD